MLDRKEEHLATGNRPSAAARIKAGVSADGIITAFDAESWGTGGAGAASGFPLPYIYRDRESPPDAQGRLHQHRPAAADAGARPSAGLVHHRDHDGRARRQGEHGSGRVPDQEPAARGAERDVAARICARGPRNSAGTSGIRPATRRPGRSRPAWASRSARGAAAAAARRRRTARSPSDGSVDHARRARRTSAPARARSSRWSPPSRSASSRRRSRRRSATRCTASAPASGGSTTAREHQPRRFASPRVKALDALKEKVAPALGVDAGALVAAGGRIHVKDTPSQGMSWADACKQIGPQPIAVDGDWAAGLVVGRRRAACSSPR